MTGIKLAAAFVLLGVTIGGTASAADRPLTGQVRRLFDCRGIQDSGQRLACFDRESAAAAQAMDRRELVFIDKERVRATRKERFGLTAPDFGGLFGNDKDDVDQIESTVASFSDSGTAMIVRLADGSVWTQTDDVFLASPRVGRKAVVRRGVMGSYRMEIVGTGSFKAKRLS